MCRAYPLNSIKKYLGLKEDKKYLKMVYNQIYCNTDIHGEKKQLNGNEHIIIIRFGTKRVKVKERIN